MGEEAERIFRGRKPLPDDKRKHRRYRPLLTPEQKAANDEKLRAEQEAKKAATPELPPPPPRPKKELVYRDGDFVAPNGYAAANGLVKACGTGGRPPQYTILSLDIQTKICDTMRRGVPFTTACRLAGVSPETGKKWLRQGRGLHTCANPAVMEAFVEAVELARAEAETVYVGHITKAAEQGQWPAAAWMLERTAPDRWGVRQALQVKIEAEWQEFLTFAVPRMSPACAKEFVGIASEFLGFDNIPANREQTIDADFSAQ